MIEIFPDRKRGNFPVTPYENNANEKGDLEGCVGVNYTSDSLFNSIASLSS